jgi:phospholysine phosphohistidine inorganic pyrophosphate phosphatase
MTEFKGVIFDISGVLEFQGVVYPGALELFHLLRRKGIIIRILTNSTLKSRQECAFKLNRMGFSVTEDEVITASFATAQYLRTLNPRSCWVMLKGNGLDEFKDFPHDDHQPEYIVVGDYREGFNFQNLNKALKLLLEGAQLIVMIPEKVDHSMGEVELTVGAYGKMLEEAAKLKAVTIGKPNPAIYDMSLLTMRLPKSSVLMVGDRVDTDITGAKAAGIKSVLVKTGEFRASHLDGELQPDYLIDSVRDLEKFFE